MAPCTFESVADNVYWATDIAFLSPAAILASSSHRSMSWRSRERFRLESVAIIDRRPHAPGVSELPFDGHGDDGHEAGCKQLLEMHEVRRRVERGAVATESVRRASMAVRSPRAIRERLEVIARLVAVKPCFSKGAR